MTKTIAVTGGAGFIGSAIIDLALQDGATVRALARRPERFARFAGSVDLVQGAVDDEQSLEALTRGADCVIHCAGVTHPISDRDYASTNVAGAGAVAGAAAKAGARLVHFSSMSARLPSASPYAASKAMSEVAVCEASGANAWIALRAPAIYGPHDHATLPYFRMVKAGIAAEPMTSPEARASILYVEDVARAALVAAFDPLASGIYEVGDESDGRSWAEIGRELSAVFGVKARRVRVPRAAIAAYHAGTRGVERALGREPTFRTGQVAEFFHPDWVARDRLFAQEARWRPQTPLKEGFAKTIRWYQENGLL